MKKWNRGDGGLQVWFRVKKKWTKDSDGWTEDVICDSSLTPEEGAQAVIKYWNDTLRPQDTECKLIEVVKAQTV